MNTIPVEMIRRTAHAKAHDACRYRHYWSKNDMQNYCMVHPSYREIFEKCVRSSPQLNLLSKVEQEQNPNSL